MKIQIERSGGFAGITREVMVDSKDLPAHLIKMFEKNQISKQISAPLRSNKSKTADCYHFRVSILEGKKKIALEINELDMNKELRSFMNDVFKKVTY